MIKEIKCPGCGKLSAWNKDNPFRPFCSERCRLTDLGDWASESHRIPDNESHLDPDNPISLDDTSS